MKKLIILAFVFLAIGLIKLPMAKAAVNPDSQPIVDLGDQTVSPSNVVENPDFAWFTPDLQAKTTINEDKATQESYLDKQIKLGLLVFSKSFFIR